ncbi:hypothetical protein BH24ACT6_BH24ACT6_19010 [soil metagenome]
MPVLGAALAVCEVSDDHVAAIAVGRRRIEPAVRPAFDALALSSPTTSGTTHPISSPRTSNMCSDGASTTATATSTRGAVERSASRSAPSLVPGADPDDPLAHDREFLAAHALTRLVAHGHVAKHPSTPEVVVLIDETSLLFGEHAATVSELHDGTRVDIDMVRRLCCEATVTAVVVSADGTVPLNVGRQARTATFSSLLAVGPRSIRAGRQRARASPPRSDDDDEPRVPPPRDTHTTARPMNHETRSRANRRRRARVSEGCDP